MAKHQPDLTLETDASDFGWGYAVHDPATGRPFGQGKWSCQDCCTSINWRELQPIVHALDENVISWSRKTVLVRLENLTTCVLINKQDSLVHAPCTN
jgi:hypothetical protein